VSFLHQNAQRKDLKCKSSPILGHRIDIRPKIDIQITDLPYFSSRLVRLRNSLSSWLNKLDLKQRCCFSIIKGKPSKLGLLRFSEIFQLVSFSTVTYEHFNRRISYDNVFWYRLGNILIQSSHLTYFFNCFDLFTNTLF